MQGTGESDLNLVLFLMGNIQLQGTRVWIREQDQLQPCTVGSCNDGFVPFTTDYGAVSIIVNQGLHEALAGITAEKSQGSKSPGLR